MIVIYPAHHRQHRPPNEIFNGNREPHAEVPERIEHIKESLAGVSGLEYKVPLRFPLSWITKVHTREYVDYVAHVSASSGRSYVYPSVFPYGPNQKTSHEVGLRGQYGFDMYTPVNNTTFEAARGSAMAALTGASYAARGERFSYALCRPPGHHAEPSRMGGYCYFNNAGIAAHYLSRRGKVAILDVDVHHGNGTQAIFYERSDVLVVNIHADPDTRFPYFTGRQKERGAGKGLGFNVNFPMPLKTGDRDYETALTRAVARVRSFTPQYFVISIGYDTHRDDPIGGFALTTAYYGHMAQVLAGVGVPTVLVQEGGYNTGTLGTVARTFVEGFVRAR